jgi:hypothetical protein
MHHQDAEGNFTAKKSPISNNPMHALGTQHNSRVLDCCLFRYRSTRAIHWGQKARAKGIHSITTSLTSGPGGLPRESPAIPIPSGLSTSHGKRVVGWDETMDSLGSGDLARHLNSSPVSLSTRIRETIAGPSRSTTSRYLRPVHSSFLHATEHRMNDRPQIKSRCRPAHSWTKFHFRHAIRRECKSICEHHQKIER